MFFEQDSDSVFSIKGGQLYIEGVSAAALAKEYGTPLYVYSKREIFSRINELREDFLLRYPGKAAVSYAGKAFLTPAFAALIASEGLNIDVTSGGELFTALKGGVSAEKIKFHGNNKTPAELEEAVSAGVGRIVIDAEDELELIEEICTRLGKKQNVLFRITPEVSAGAHAHIMTGKRDSKFGIPMDEGVLFPLIERAIASERLDFLGFHFHIGSQLFEAEPYVEALERVLPLLAEVKKRFGAAVCELVIGGGFGARYVEGDERKTYSYFLDPIMKRLAEFCTANATEQPVVGIEPGRSIVAEAGVSLYTVGSIKQIPGGKKYIAVDGGMSDNIRPALYSAKYEAILANKANALQDEIATICGKLCESGDRLIDDAKIAKARRGDILCIFSTGAYGYAMASNYNKNTKAAVVLVDGEKSELLVRRQTYADMLAQEL